MDVPSMEMSGAFLPLGLSLASLVLVPEHAARMATAGVMFLLQRFADMLETVKGRLAVLVCAAVAVPAGFGLAGEKLVCAIVHKGSDYSAARTEIIAVDPVSGERRLLFSDQHSPILLIQHLYVFHFPVAGGSRVFAHAVDRGRPAPYPGQQHDSLYELSTDGTGRVRKICPVQGVESLGDIVVNAAGTRIAYLNRLDRKQMLFVHDVASGTLVAQVDMTGKILDCVFSSMGWLPGSDSICFSLEVGDADLTSEESYPLVGTYVMDQAGRSMRKLPPLPAADGSIFSGDVRLIGVFPTGEYLFEAALPGQYSSHGVSLPKVSKEYARTGEFRFSPGATIYAGIRVNYSLSPSGKYLAATSLPVSSSSTSCDVWLMTMTERAERKILSVPTKGLEGPFLGLVGWLNE